MRPPKDLPPAIERQLRRKPRRLGDRGADGGVRDPRRIGPLAALLHIGELVAERGDAAGFEPLGDRPHERMRHAGAGAMGEHVAGERLRGRNEEPRHIAAGADGERQVLDSHLLLPVVRMVIAARLSAWRY